MYWKKHYNFISSGEWGLSISFEDFRNDFFSRSNIFVSWKVYDNEWFLQPSPCTFLVHILQENNRSIRNFITIATVCIFIRKIIIIHLLINAGWFYIYSTFICIKYFMMKPRFVSSVFYFYLNNWNTIYYLFIFLRTFAYALYLSLHLTNIYVHKNLCVKILLE